jgi:hypothetical protein
MPHNLENESECFLCRISTGTMDIPWSDRPLWLDPRFGLLVPGLGGLTPGYVLLAPMDHHPSLGAASHLPDSRKHGFPNFVHEVLAFLRARMGPLTYWEHGGGGAPEERRSSCVDHAHLHVVPGRLDLPCPPDHMVFPGITEALTALAASRIPADPYLLMGQSPGLCFVGRDVGISQYYRREWAKILDKADEWDYILTEDPVLTRNTIRSFFSAGM